MIPKLIEDSNTEETIFVLSNPKILKATQEFFKAPSTKFVKELPSTAVSYFNYFVYGIVMSANSIKFKTNELLEDFVRSFTYDYPQLSINQVGTLIEFEPETILEIRYEVEDLLDTLL